MSFAFSNLVALVPPLLLIEGFFSGSEIALFSSDKLFLKRQARHGNKRALMALELASHPERILSTTQLMTNSCTVGISGLVALYFISNYPEHGELLAIFFTSPLIVLLGELIPKALYRKNANQAALWVAYPIYITYFIFFPITRIISAYTTRLSRFVGPIEELLAGKKKTTRDDLRALLSYNKKETEIKASEKRMIKRIFDFKDTEAKHALIPLVQVDAIEESATVYEALEKFERHRHSRMPVYSERIDNIVGVLESSDLLSATDLQQQIRLYITPAHYVAETQSLEDLMLDMRREDAEMVIVVDEHGGAVGVLTFEDIIEEIVGEIADEYDSETLPYRALSETSWLIQARMEIGQMHEVLRIELPQGDYETLSGFLLQQFGRIPEMRDELFFDTPSGSYKFTVKRATERHIESVLVEKIEPL